MNLRKFAQDKVQLAQKIQEYTASKGTDAEKRTKKIRAVPEAYVPRYIGITTPWGAK